MPKSVFLFFSFIFWTTAPAAYGQQQQVSAEDVINDPDALIERMEMIFTNLGEGIGGFVFGLLFALIAVDLVFTYGRMLITNGELGEAMYAFLRRAMIVILVMFIVQNSGPILEQLASIATSVAGAATGNETLDDPSISKILFSGAGIAWDMIGQTSLKSISTYPFILIAVFQLIITALAALIILSAYAELYAVAPTGLIMLGFAGLKQTENSGFAYLKVVIGASVKLMAVLVIYTFMMQISLEFASLKISSGGSAGWSRLTILFMIQLMTPIMMATLPSQVSQMISPINGYGATEMAGRMGASAAVGAMGTTAGVLGGAAGGLVAGTLQGGMAAKSAGQSATDVAKAALKAGGGKALSSGLKYGSTLSKGGGVMNKALSGLEEFNEKRKGRGSKN